MDKIFTKQLKFQELLKNNISSQEFRNQMFLGLFEETAELMNETPFKKHKKNQKFSKVGFVEEAVDIQLYLINLLLTVGIAFDEFKEQVDKKVEINFRRQKDNY